MPDNSQVNNVVLKFHYYKPREQYKDGDENIRKRDFVSCNGSYNYVSYVHSGASEQLPKDYEEYIGNKEKSCGTFNQNGLMTDEQLKELRTQLQSTNSCIWDMVIFFKAGFGEKYCRDFEQAFEFVSEDIRSKAIEDFKEISNNISSFYKDAIFDLQNKYKIKEFCCVHKDSENELNIWYEKRKPFIERNKIVRNLTTLSEKLEPIKDYVSMPALPYYLFGAKNILEVNSMDETDPYHKCKKAHKNDLQMGCILYPELLSKDKVHTLYSAPIEFKQYGNLEQLSNNYEAKE